LNNISTDLLSENDWYYNSDNGTINISWTSTDAIDIGAKNIIGIPAIGLNIDELTIETSFMDPECYIVNDEVTEVKGLKLNVRGTEISNSEYQLFQNKPNPFKEGTMISFALPKREVIRMTIYDITGKKIYDHSGDYHAGRNDLYIKGEIIPSPGIYYYTLYTSNASLTRKMSFTNE
ncbi:MAG: T9SS type A sorting domain-containing protein, partial [Saprospiraceae bacterium]